jgi:hypothetical protein
MSSLSRERVQKREQQMVAPILALSVGAGGLWEVEVSFGEAVDLQCHAVVLAGFSHPFHSDVSGGGDAAAVAWSYDGE